MVDRREFSSEDKEEGFTSSIGINLERKEGCKDLRSRGRLRIGMKGTSEGVLCRPTIPPPNHEVYNSPPFPTNGQPQNRPSILTPGDKSYLHRDSVITGREGWKTLKGKTEAALPPSLEVVLAKGPSPILSCHLHPHLITPTQSLSRYEPSNRGLPNPTVESLTVNHRTPKQVGSRLQ